MSPSRGEFARLLAGFDHRGYARFLAALARARGDDARAEGRVVVHGDGRRVLTHAPPRRLPVTLAARVDPTGVDAVATTHPGVATRLRGRGVAVVGPEAVRRRLLYGVDRSRADGLAREHLGRALDAAPPPTVGERLGRATVGVAVLTLLAAAVLVALVGTGASPASSPSAAAERDWVDSDPDGAANATLAPGLTRAGAVDPGALAAAHGAALGEGPYVAEVSYREFLRRDRSYPRAARLRTVRVAGPRRYHLTATGWGEPSVAPVPTTRGETYADGEARFVRPPGPSATVERLPPGPRTTDPHAVRGAEYVRRFLDASRTDVVETRVEDGETLHRVAVRGTDEPGLAAYSASALVTSDGLVRELRVAYVRPERSIAVSLLVRYDPGGPVEPPAWVPGNATAPTDDPRGGRYPD